MFIGVDMFRLHGRDLDRALKAAPIIHASDTATVLALQRNKQLSPERARPLAHDLGAQHRVRGHRLPGLAEEPVVTGPTGADVYDYVVVGSGAGGGPVAANLAEAGHRVLLLEAGLDAEDDDYRVPAFHGRASEHPGMSWPFYVRHFDDTAQQERDEKYVPEQDGVLYPRSGTLGGCTAHNAMITVYPHDADWDGIAAATGDASWRVDADAPVVRAAGGLPVQAPAADAAEAPVAGQAAGGAAVPERQVRQPQPARLRRLAAHEPRRPRAGAGRQAGHLGDQVRRGAQPRELPAPAR